MRHLPTVLLWFAAFTTPWVLCDDRSTAYGQAGGQITGVVLDPVREPMATVRVTAIPEAGGPIQSAVTDSSGSYRLSGLPGGTYRVDLEQDGFYRVRRHHVQVRPGEVTDVSAALRVGPLCECVTIQGAPRTPPSLVGHVVDNANRPLPYARVELGGGISQVGYTDHEGRFTIHGPLPQKWHITASDSGFAVAVHELSGWPPMPVVIRLTFTGAHELSNTEQFEPLCCGGVIGRFTIGSR